MIDYPERNRLRKLNNTWYVEVTRTLDDPDERTRQPRPKQYRYFIPIVEIHGDIRGDGTLLKNAGKTPRGGENLYMFEEMNPDPNKAIYGRHAYVGIMGNQQGVMTEEIPIPRPKTKHDVRWYRGHWQEQLKRGWRDIPYEWIDAAVAASKPPKPKFAHGDMVVSADHGITKGQVISRPEDYWDAQLGDYRHQVQTLEGSGPRRVFINEKSLSPYAGATHAPPKPKAPRKPRTKSVRLQGPEVRRMEGFALTPPPERLCIGPRKMRHALTDTLGVYDPRIDDVKPVDDETLQRAADSLSLLSEQTAVPRYAVGEAISRALGSEDWDLDLDALSDRGILEFSEEGDMIRFQCTDKISVPEEPPSTGQLSDALAWSLSMAGMDPALAPAVEAALVEAPTNERGEIIDSELQPLIESRIKGTFLPQDWFHELMSRMNESGAVLQVYGYADGYWLSWFPPPAVPRTPLGLGMYLAEVRRKLADQKVDPRGYASSRMAYVLDAIERQALSIAERSSDPAVVAAVRDALAPRLLIQQPDVLDIMEGLEGAAWSARQRKVGLSDPTSLASNLAAFEILRDLGDDGAGLIVSDIVPGAGLIAGEDGHGFALMPDGEIMLLGETADGMHINEARKVMRVAT